MYFVTNANFIRPVCLFYVIAQQNTTTLKVVKCTEINLAASRYFSLK
jgi:hypothetical protein